MKVETDLAPRDHAFVVDQRLDLLFGVVVVETSVVRMCADGGVNCSRAFWPNSTARSNAPLCGSPVPTFRIVETPAALCALDDLVAIGVKLRPINMRMRVDEH